VKEATMTIDTDWIAGYADGTLDPERRRLVEAALAQDPTLAVTLRHERESAPKGSFAIVVCLAGKVECAGAIFKAGDFFLVPASLEERRLRPNGEDTLVLRVTVPR